MSDFAEALANPIKYQSELEKRSEQLAVFEDGEPTEEDTTNSCKCNQHFSLDSSQTHPFSSPFAPQINFQIFNSTFLTFEFHSDFAFDAN